MNPYENEAYMAYEQGRKDAENEIYNDIAEQENSAYMEEHEYYKLYSDAVERFGIRSQKQKCIEEMAELIQAICKGNNDNIIEEMVDVDICLEQLKYIMFNEDDGNRQLYDIVTDYKRERLQERIDNG